MNVHHWVRAASVRLAAAGIEASRLEAQVLAAHALGEDRSYVLAHPEANLPAKADELLELRLKGEPLAYLLGYREFYGRRFKVTPATLIPRQETEVLVEAVMARAPQGGRVVDIGTGTGCIAVTLNWERPDLTILATDVSSEALEVARENARVLAAVIEFHEADLLKGVEGAFDVIVSNPPYIRLDADLPNDVRDHEPATALFAGEDGLAIYRRLATETLGKLKPNGLLALELGDDMAPDVIPLFQNENWQKPELLPDLSGRDRVLFAKRAT